MEDSFTLGEMLRAQTENSWWILMLQCIITASFCFHVPECQLYQRYFSTFEFFFEIFLVKQINLKQHAAKKPKT